MRASGARFTQIHSRQILEALAAATQRLSVKLQEPNPIINQIFWELILPIRPALAVSKKILALKKIKTLKIWANSSSTSSPRRVIQTNNSMLYYSKCKVNTWRKATKTGSWSDRCLSARTSLSFATTWKATKFKAKAKQTLRPQATFKTKVGRPTKHRSICSLTLS